jgi:hypothetical protein
MVHPSAPGAITAQLTPALHQHGVAAATTTTLHSMISPATATAHHATPALASMPMPGGRMDPGCADGCCVMCGGMHACVFILTALVLILGLALLGRVGSDTDAAARLGRGWAIRHARPPPWTMPSLSELSILRI